MIGRLLCFFGRHRFTDGPLVFNALYFCQRGCGCEMFGRPISALDSMPPLSDEQRDVLDSWDEAQRS